ncbi:MAG TPA: helix-turn-helix domain-containing protein, partial [Streptosporangiaceae bacterium]|nr:helix-turn-helix domain-containing protein [Streptosporangiaceae bacterium]
PARSLPLPRIDDPPTLRALAHPIRLALLEALGRREPLTATQAAGLIGETPSACSFHLRMLAKYGLVTDAGGGQGRRRPWRRAYPAGFEFPAADADEQTSLAAQALSDLVWGRYLERARTALARRPGLSAQAQAISNAAQTVAYVTQQEAERLAADLQALLCRYQDRLADPSLRPQESLPLEILLFSYPLDVVVPGAE